MARKYRRWLNRHSAVVTMGAIALLVTALVAIFFQARPRPLPGPVDVWYYDLETGTLFVAGSDRVPPIEVPGAAPDSNRPSGVRAYVFSCGECGTDQQYIGWLEMYTPQARQMLEGGLMEDGGGGNPEMWMEMTTVVEEGQLIRAGEIGAADELGDSWVPMNSDAGMEIMERAGYQCGEGRVARPCLPPDEAS